MELPWLKRKNQGGGGPVEREADQTHPDKLLETVADELLDSYHRGDSRAFLHSLRAFVLMNQQHDKEF